MARKTIHQWLCLLVRLVAVPTGILHRGIGRPGDPSLGQCLMAVKTALAQRQEFLLFY